MSVTRSSFESERDRVIHATLELCAEHGYDEITVDQLAERAGVATTTLESLFEGGKEECLIAAENALLADVMTAVSIGYSADRSEWDNVIHGVLAILELMAANPSAAHVGYVVARQMSPSSVQEIYAAGFRMLTVMLERGWAYSQHEAKPPTAAIGSLGGAEALMRQEILRGRADQLPRLLPDFVYSATVPFLGQEEALRLVRQARRVLRGTRWEGEAL